MYTDKKQVFSALKQVLKVKGITYSELAKKLEMSESGIKKVFQEKNCSLDKLLKICGELDIQVGELFELAERPLINKHLQINSDLDQFFIENPRIFYLLRFIQTKNYSKDWLYEKGFDDTDFENLKVVMNKNGLIKETDSIFILKGSCLRFEPMSILRKKLTNKIGINISNKVFKENAKLSSSEDPILWSQALSKTDEDNLRREMIEILEKYTKRSTLYREHLSDEEHELTYIIIPTRFTPGSDEVDNLDII